MGAGLMRGPIQESTWYVMLGYANVCYACYAKLLNGQQLFFVKHSCIFLTYLFLDLGFEVNKTLFLPTLSHPVVHNPEYVG